MNLSIVGFATQAAAPVLDAASLVRTGGIEQIASFLRDNPDQRGTIESALAAGGRAGDLSAIVERAGSPAGQVAQGARDSVGAGIPATGTATRDVQTAGGEVASRIAVAASETMSRPGQIAGAILDRAATSAEAVARPIAPAADGLARAGGGAADLLARPAAGDGLARAPMDAGRAAPSVDTRLVPGTSRGPDTASMLSSATRTAGPSEFATRVADTLAVAMRDGRDGAPVTAAAKEGRLAELVADARATGRLPELVSAERTLDGVLAAFAAKGGLSATELALLARAGLLPETDAQALRDMGVPVDEQTDDQPLQPAPRDGPADERFDTDPAPADGVVPPYAADAALARFDAGAIRIVSRAAVEIYGVLGPPGGMVIAADAFEALLRAAEGDLASVERQLELEGGTLTDPDTLVAFVERRDMASLRLVPEGFGAAAASWLPGGDKAGGVLSALADLDRRTPFREMTFAGKGR